MERTVPEVASEEIELFVRTTYSLLRASTEVRVRSLEEAHAAMKSLLHPLARSKVVDMSAFVYSVLRLPPVISDVKRWCWDRASRPFWSLASIRSTSGKRCAPRPAAAAAILMGGIQWGV